MALDACSDSSFDNSRIGVRRAVNLGRKLVRNAASYLVEEVIGCSKFADNEDHLEQ